MIGHVIKNIPKNYKIWLRPKAPKPENLERSPSVNVKQEELLKAEDLKTKKSLSTKDREDNCL
jgi:hypothetical protein